MTAGGSIVFTRRSALLHVAREYGRATGRTAVCAPALGPVADARDAVLVVQPDDLDSEFLDELLLLQQRRESVPGIVIGRSPEELRMRLRRLVRHLREPLSGEAHRTDVLPTLPIGRIMAGARTVVGGSASAEVMREVLLSQHDLLHCYTHSDGIDAFLHRELTLCPFTRSAPSAGERMPRCAREAYCTRHRRPLQAARLADRLFDPARIRARVAVFLACLAVPAADGFVDPRASAGMAMALTPEIGALVATTDVAFAFPSFCEPLLEDLLRGVPIGEAVASFHGSPHELRRTTPLLLFGDPSMRLTKARAARRSAAPAGLSIDGRDDAADPLSLVIESGLGSDAPVIRTRAGKARDAFGSASFPAAMVRYLVTRGWITSDWMPHAALSVQRDGGTATIDANVGGAKRRVTTCRRRAVIEDVPADSTIRMIVDGAAARLTGDLPSEPWAAGWLLWSQVASDGVVLACGESVARVVVPAHRFGPMYLTAYIVTSSCFWFLNERLLSD